MAEKIQTTSKDFYVANATLYSHDLLAKCCRNEYHKPPTAEAKKYPVIFMGKAREIKVQDMSKPINGLEFRSAPARKLNIIPYNQYKQKLSTEAEMQTLREELEREKQKSEIYKKVIETMKTQPILSHVDNYTLEAALQDSEKVTQETLSTLKHEETMQIYGNLDQFRSYIDGILSNFITIKTTYAETSAKFADIIAHQKKEHRAALENVIKKENITNDQKKAQCKMINCDNFLRMTLFNQRAQELLIIKARTDFMTNPLMQMAPSPLMQTMIHPVFQPIPAMIAPAHYIPPVQQQQQQIVQQPLLIAQQQQEEKIENKKVDDKIAEKETVKETNKKEGSIATAIKCNTKETPTPTKEVLNVKKENKNATILKESKTTINERPSQTTASAVKQTTATNITTGKKTVDNNKKEVDEKKNLANNTTQTKPQVAATNQQSQKKKTVKEQTTPEKKDKKQPMKKDTAVIVPPNKDAVNVSKYELYNNWWYIDETLHCDVGPVAQSVMYNKYYTTCEINNNTYIRRTKEPQYFKVCERYVNYKNKPIFCGEPPSPPKDEIIVEKVETNIRNIVDKESLKKYHEDKDKVIVKSIIPQVKPKRVDPLKVDYVSKILTPEDREKLLKKAATTEKKVKPTKPKAVDINDLLNKK